MKLANTKTTLILKLIAKHRFQFSESNNKNQKYQHQEMTNQNQIQAEQRIAAKCLAIRKQANALSATNIFKKVQVMPNCK